MGPSTQLAQGIVLVRPRTDQDICALHADSKHCFIINFGNFEHIYCYSLNAFLSPLQIALYLLSILDALGENVLAWQPFCSEQALAIPSTFAACVQLAADLWRMRLAVIRILLGGRRRTFALAAQDSDQAALDYMRSPSGRSCSPEGLQTQRRLMRHHYSDALPA